MPSVVSIVNLSVQEVQNFFFGGTTQYESQSSGSGIIIGQNDTELLLVTNNHVVQGSKTLTVTFNDGKSHEAQIKGTDSDLDLAILSVPLSGIEKSTMEAIKVATLGDSDALRVGEPTIAIGNALGYGQSVTAGIVSALNCTLENYEGKLIQTDAAINPGNSGGALLNANGEVIGINTMKVSDQQVEGMGYSIPISDVVDILNELMNKETRTKVPESARGALGIKGITVASDMSQYYNMPKGVYVSEVIEGGAADKAELPVNSIIIKIDGNSVDSMEELQEELQYYKVGDTVELTIKVQDRSGYVKEKVQVTLGKPQ
jgi:serine protease Do